MPVSSVWNLRPLQREAETKTFRDPEQPEWHLTLTLRPMDGVSGTKYAVLKAELMVKHVTGLVGPNKELIRDNDGKPVQEPEPVTCGDFQKRMPDEFVIDRYCKLVAMWADPEEPPPPLMEVIGWQALLYEGWFEIANWIEDLYNRGSQRGNAGAAATAASSEPCSKDTESTQKSPSDGTPSCAASSAGSGKPLGNSGGCEPAPVLAAGAA
jgi:hypothetical protein